MIEFVFRPSRTVAGKRTVSRLFSGRYAVEKGTSPVTVRLNTPDREIARKRLRDIVLEKQREQEGIIAPKAVRMAAAASLGDLVNEYETDLQGRGLDGKHVHDSITRVRRMLAQTGWARLSDVLGHSDANLTAKAYTDVPALGLNAEVAKVPWISAPGESAQRSAQKSAIPGHPPTLGGILAQLIPFMEKASGEELSHTLAFSDAPWRFLKLGAGAGFEPAIFRL